MFEESPPEPPQPPAPPRAVEEPRRAAPDTAERGLISAATTAAVDSAFNTLAQTVLVQNGRTLEDLVREMLRPMLKTWLDDNLPAWSSAWCAPRSSGSRADEGEANSDWVERIARTHQPKMASR